MTIMEEINELLPLLISKPNLVGKVHEDNQSCIRMATGTNVSPEIRHKAFKNHHFISHEKYVRVYIQ